MSGGIAVWTIVIASVTVSILLLCYLAAMAPAGYEDEKGWHPGGPADDRVEKSAAKDRRE